MNNQDYVYRVSKFYVLKALIPFFIMLIVVGYLSKHLQDYPFAKYFLLTIVIAGLIYQLIELRAQRLFLDQDGVWFKKGYFPWSRGLTGVYWRDLESAGYYDGVLPWIFNSYSVVLNRRGRNARIVLPEILRGKEASGIINSHLESFLAAQQKY